MHTEDHNYVCSSNSLFTASRDAQALDQRSCHFRKQLGWTAQCQFGACFAEQMNFRTGHAAVINISQNCDLQAGELLLMFQNRVGIEQRLLRMLMHAVACVDNRYVQIAGHQVRRSRIEVPHYDRVRANRAQGVSRVEQRLAFLNARSTGDNQTGFGAECLCCHFERRAGPRGSLVEQKQNTLATQQRTGLRGIHLPGEQKQLVDFRNRKIFDPEKRTPGYASFFTLWPACGH